MLHDTSRAIYCQVGWTLNPNTGAVFRIGCGRWDCPDCGPRRRADFAARAGRITRSHKYLKSLTVTAPGNPTVRGSNSASSTRLAAPRPAPARCAECVHLDGKCRVCVRTFDRSWRGFWQSVCRYVEGLGLGVQKRPQSVWVNEQGDRTGHLHKHVVADLPYIPHELLKRWAVSAGLGEQVYIEALRDPDGGVGYAMKSLTSYMVKGRDLRWGKHVRRAQSSRGLGRPAAEHSERWPVALDAQNEWNAHLRSEVSAGKLDAAEAAKLRDAAVRSELEAWHYDQRTCGEFRAQGSFDWNNKRGSLPQKRGTEPDSGMPGQSLASVPDGFDGALGGRARRQPSVTHLRAVWERWEAEYDRPWSVRALSSLDLEKNCISTLSEHQESVK